MGGLAVIISAVIAVLFVNSLWGPRGRRLAFGLIGRLPALLVTVLTPGSMRRQREIALEQRLTYLADPWRGTPTRYWWLQGAGLLIGMLFAASLALWMSEGHSKVKVTLPGGGTAPTIGGSAPQNAAQPNATPTPDVNAENAGNNPNPGGPGPFPPPDQAPPGSPPPPAPTDDTAPSGFVFTIGIALAAALGTIGWFYPRQALRRRVEQRKQRLLLQLADLLELMAITMRAGAEFDQALETATRTIYDRYNRKPDQYPLGVELAQALFERNMGVSRADFMESLGLRATMRTERHENEFSDAAVTLWDELTQAVTLSQEVGSSLKDTLPEIVERVRGGRLKAAEQVAATARITIIYPQGLLVLALMITLLGSVGLFIANLF
ncbi:MAG: hypothetical protein ACYDBJ_24185 [Aggregatilineales bacterium]